MINKFQTYFLYLTLFLTGAIILVIEIIGTSILAPLYGSTIYVWSSLITVTLACLALGYIIGGIWADKKPLPSIFYLIIFLAGALIFTISKIDGVILPKFLRLGVVWGPLASSVIIFSLPLFLLGMVSPFAIKLNTKN